MDKVREFFSKYKLQIIVGVLFVILEIVLISLGNYYSESKTVESKDKIKSLDKENKILLKERQELTDSMEYLHLQALIQNSKDTVYINQIYYLKTKTNEDIKNIYTLNPDSSLKLYSLLSEEYISTGFNK